MLSRVQKVYSILLLSFIALYSVGCGDSDDGFVYTGDQPGNVTELVFRFQRPVTAQTLVPTGTVTIRFDLHSTETPSPATLLSTETRLYADLIVLQNVAPETRSVKVTLLNRDGVPVGVYSKPITVTPGSRQEVSLEQELFVPPAFTDLIVNPNPIDLYLNFDGTETSRTRLSAESVIDGVRYALPFESVSASVEHPSVVQVLESGIVTGDTGPLTIALFFESLNPRLNTTVTASYTLDQVTRQSTIPVRLHIFFSILRANIFALALTEIPIPQGSTLPILLDENDRYYYVGPDSQLVNIPSEDVTWKLASDNDSISFNATTGEIEVPADVPIGTRFSIESTWLDDRVNGTNHTFVENIKFVVFEANPG